MQEANRIEQTSNPLRYVNAGDIIGYQGDSGNLGDAIADGYCESHLHVSAYVHDGSNSWSFNNFGKSDPRDYLATTITDDGLTETTIDCN